MVGSARMIRRYLFSAAFLFVGSLICPFCRFLSANVNKLNVRILRTKVNTEKEENENKDKNKERALRPVCSVLVCDSLGPQDRIMCVRRERWYLSAIYRLWSCVQCVYWHRFAFARVRAACARCDAIFLFLGTFLRKQSHSHPNRRRRTKKKPNKNRLCRIDVGFSHFSFAFVPSPIHPINTNYMANGGFRLRENRDEQKNCVMGPWVRENKRGQNEQI